MFPIFVRVSLLLALACGGAALAITASAAEQEQEQVFAAPATGDELMAVPVRIEPVGGGEVEILPIEEDRGTGGGADGHGGGHWRMDDGGGHSGPENNFGVVGAWGLRLTAPQIVAATVGMVIGKTRCLTSHVMDGCEGYGLLIQGDAGVGGGKVSVGFGAVDGIVGSKIGKGDNGFIIVPFLGAAVKASLLRTWGQALGVAVGKTYAGGELEVTYWGVNASLGVLKRVSQSVEGDDPDDDWILTGGLGVGF